MMRFGPQIETETKGSLVNCLLEEDVAEAETWRPDDGFVGGFSGVWIRLHKGNNISVHSSRASIDTQRTPGMFVPRDMQWLAL